MFEEISVMNQRWIFGKNSAGKELGAYDTDFPRVRTGEGDAGTGFLRVEESLSAVSIV